MTTSAGNVATELAKTWATAREILGMILKELPKLVDDEGNLTDYFFGFEPGTNQESVWEWFDSHTEIGWAKNPIVAKEMLGFCAACGFTSSIKEERIKYDAYVTEYDGKVITIRCHNGGLVAWVWRKDKDDQLASLYKMRGVVRNVDDFRLVLLETQKFIDKMAQAYCLLGDE